MHRMTNLSQDHLRQILEQHCPNLGDAVSFEPITTGKFNTSYFIHAGGREMVLRIAPPRGAVFLFYEKDMMRQEPVIHRHLLEKTSIPVARILAFDDSLSIIDRDYMLMDRLPGAPLTDVPSADFNTVLRQIGQYLAQAHALKADNCGYLGAHHPMEPQNAWVDAFGIMWNRLIDDIVFVGHFDTEEESLFRNLLDRHLKHFDRPVPFSLLHMDVWHQNILVNSNSEVTGIVDWDRGLWGDPEIEYAVLDYCGISEPAFWEGYGKRRDSSAEARLRQTFYLLYELLKYIVIREGRNNDSPGARLYKEQALTIVSQTFKSA